MSEEKSKEEIAAEAVINELEEEQTGDGEANEERSLEEQLAASQEEAARNLDNFLRAQAELSNVRKRFEKQQAQVYTNANADLVLKLLPILDDFDRAMESVPENISQDHWFEGIELVQRKFRGILDALNVREIEAVGQPFDPNFHDALAQEPSDEHDSGIVTREMIKGYQLGERVIRPSLVYVAE